MSAAYGPARRIAATAGLMLATLMVTIDMTIANVALPHMQGSLSASQEQTTWVLTSYMLATAIMTPLSGWLSLRIGRKQVFLLSTVSFVLMSVLCGLATSLTQIVLFRFLQGLAGASMMPVSQASLLELWPKRYTAHIMAVWSAVVMAAPIIGPTLGGWLTEAFSWRSVFYINIPLGAVGFAGVYLALPRDPGGLERPFDALGYAALVLFTTCTQLMLDRGTIRDWFDSREICIYAVVAACSLYVFILQTLTAAHPFFPRELFRDRNFASCIAFSLLISGVLFASSSLLPLMMQNLMGYSAFQSGWATMPRGFGSILSFAVAPWLIGRLGPRPVILAGWLISVFALWQMAHFDLAMDDGPIKATGFVQSFGSGLMFNPMTVIMFATLPPLMRTEAAVAGGMLRNLGGSLGVAIAAAFSVRRSAIAHEGLAAHLSPTDPVIRWSLPHVFDGAGAGLAALNAEVTRQAAMIGYDAAFGWMFLASIAIVPCVFIMRPVRTGGTTVLELPTEA